MIHLSPDLLFSQLKAKRMEENGKNKRKRIETSEEADLKSFPANSSISVGTRCYFLKLVGDLRYEDVVGADSKDDFIRREFVVRLGHIDILLEYQDKRIQRLHKASGATIAIISYPEGRLHFQARLELWGTTDQVKTAESLILKELAKGYPTSCVPTILMQAPVFHAEVYVPLAKVLSDLLGVGFRKLKELEAQTGAWIEVDTHKGPGKGLLQTSRLKVFGSRMNIYQALTLIHRAILKPYIGVESMVEGEKKQHREIYVSSDEVTDLLFNNVTDLEALSGARIEVDALEDVGEGYLRMRGVKIFGCREEIFKVVKLVYETQLKPFLPEDPVAAEVGDENKQATDPKWVKEAKDRTQVYAATTEHADASNYKLPGGI